MIDSSLLPEPDFQGNFAYEQSLYKKGCKSVAGTDEVGRGPLAGPVIAACVVLPICCDHTLFVDSKALTHKKRVLLFETLYELNAQIGIGIVSETIIDQINILQASLLAMRLAFEEVAKKHPTPDFLLVDGTFKVPMEINQLPLIKGETKSASIAAASIIAKVTRDRYMRNLHDQFPVYGFNTNQGYPTKKHREALKEHGSCPHHRQTFNGVKDDVTISKKSR